MMILLTYVMINIKRRHIGLPLSSFQQTHKRASCIASKNTESPGSHKYQTNYYEDRGELLQLIWKKQRTASRLHQVPGGPQSMGNRNCQSHNQSNPKRRRQSQNCHSIKQEEGTQQDRKTTKQHLKTNTELNYTKTNWKRNILRRKNHGSQGQIITGLSASRHSLVIEKAKVHDIQESTVLEPDLSTNFEELKQKFEPMGTITKMQTISDEKINDRYSHIKPRRRTMKQLTLQSSQGDQKLTRVHLQTEPNQLLVSRGQISCKIEHSHQRMQKKSRITSQKLHHSQRVSAFISPWNFQGMS